MQSVIIQPLYATVIECDMTFGTEHLQALQTFHIMTHSNCLDAKSKLSSIAEYHLTDRLEGHQLYDIS